MGNGRNFFGKKRKGGLKPTTKKKRKLLKEEEATINKKSLFNRYKNKQKVDEVLLKKKQMEERFQLQQVAYSESEEEDNAYGQLVSCLGSVKKTKVADSDDSISEDSSEISEALSSDQEMDNELEDNVNDNVLLDGNDNGAICESDGSSSDEQEIQENTVIIFYCLLCVV